ncbi:MAG: Nif3-like dinuclear metal center hexameric protein [Leptospirales bacterium]
MVDRDELEKFLNGFLNVKDFDDYAPNGLQVEGKPQIQKLAVSVSISEQVIHEAVEMKADAILVHHGHFWKNTPPIITGAAKRKIALLLKNDISLFAYHLPLDFLAEYGNNHPAIKDLGVEQPEPFDNIGYTGKLNRPVSSAELIDRLEKYYGAKGTYVLPNEENAIEHLTLVSGGGQSWLSKTVSIDNGAFVTGEGSEWVYNMARENNLFFAAMGHYTTEIVGPKKLAEFLQNKFNLEWDFIKEENPF